MSFAQLVITPIQTSPTQTTANIALKKRSILPTESWPTSPLGVQLVQTAYLTECSWCNGV